MLRLSRYAQGQCRYIETFFRGSRLEAHRDWVWKFYSGKKIEASKRRTRTCSAVMIAQRHPRYRAVGTTYEYAKAPPCVRCLRLPCNSRVQWEQHLVLGIMNSVRQELVGVTVSSGLLRLFAHSDWRLEISITIQTQEYSHQCVQLTVFKVFLLVRHEPRN